VGSPFPTDDFPILTNSGGRAIRIAASDLALFFRPKGVVVVGASREPGKLGYGVVRNLIEHRYDGPVYPVNPRADEVMGLKTYASVADVPDPVDLAVIVVPANLVADALEACGRRGVKGAVVVSAGFREAGPEGVEREERIRQVAQQFGIALLGPNCIGTIDTHTPLNTTFVIGNPRPGDIAFLSQSGAVAAVIIDWAEESGVGFSRIVSLGNQAGVTEAEMLEAIVQDDHTRVVTAYIEGVSDGRAFLEASSRVAQGTPIVALKVGRGAGGARAVASHTGALAGTEAAYDAAFRRAGILRAGSLEEMLDWARALAWQPLPGGNRVAVLTNAGGPGILAVDALEAAGMQLAPLTEETRAFLRQHVPPAASVENPVDILAGSGPETYALCLDALLADETVDAVVVITAPQEWFPLVSLAEVIGDASEGPPGRHKPMLASIMGPDPAGDAAREMSRRRIPDLAFPDRLGSALGVLWRRKGWLDSLADDSPAMPAKRPNKGVAQAAIEAGLEEARRRAELGQTDETGACWMSPDQTEALLKAYGIRTPHGKLVREEEEALAAAESIGYPVALKLAAPGLTHKTDVGGVVLDIASPEALQSAFREMTGRLDAGGGVHVQQMVRGEVEVIVGMVRDPQFGPLVMAGSGGTQVELMGDVTFELAPLTRKQAGEMLDWTGAGRLLAGYRGRSPADRQAVIDVVQLLAQLALDWPQIAEIEMNPLTVMPEGEGAYAVDVRACLTPGDG
jgi:acetyltransferase